MGMIRGSQFKKIKSMNKTPKEWVQGTEKNSNKWYTLQ